ncbi:PspC domain-containing protein [Nocardiopsis alborubida]|uniref:PspC domain-containing protein n=1 Tax=Nocardiopsis alborubida TaxID=146802 RepID=A0A7X6RQM4_9ACTN|nr:PspC domain-containing protein [Nocardiopsis alborubida]NKY98392.1 PspC domain-containing protein [Nocardiopsis alborubida]
MTMTDDPVPEGAPAASAAGTAEADAGTSVRELRKGDEDRVLAGVCAGLGRYTGVDPVVWRAAFVLTSFAGAAGLLLYIAAWMLMRDAQGVPATFEQMLNRSIPPRTVPKLLAVGLAVATTFSLVGGLGWSTLVLAVPLVLGLLAARNRGVDLRTAFAELREDLRTTEPPPATPSPEPTATYYNPAQPWASAPQGPVDLAVVSERTAARDSGETGDEDEGEEEPSGEAGGSRTRKAEDGCSLPKGRRLPLASLALWTVVAGAVLVPVLEFGWSSSLWSGRTADLLLGPETGVFFLAGSLAVIGVYALVGAWAGSPRGLIPMGAAAVLLLVLASVTDLTRVRIGDETWRPTTVAAAESGDHRLTVGSGTLDLTGLEDLEPGGTVDVSLRMGAGRVELVLPEDAEVAVHSEIGLGAVEFGPKDGRDDMFGVSLDYEEVHGAAADTGSRGGDGAGAPRINVRTDSLVGVVEVKRGGA